MKLKKKKKLLLVMLLPLIALGAATVSLKINTKTASSKIIDNQTGNHRIAYVLTSSNLVVPLTVEIDKYDDIGQEILALINLIKADSPLMKKGFVPVLHQDIKVNSINIDNKIIKIDFSQQFFEYKAERELVILQALVYNLTQFRQINKVEVSVDSEVVKQMPHKGTIINGLLDRKIGINNVSDASVNQYNAMAVTTYCQKKINDLNVLIPLTKNIEYEPNRIQAYTNQIFNANCNVLGFAKPDFLHKIKPLSTPTITSGVVTIDLNEHALEDETAMRKEVYNYIAISYHAMEEVEDINILVEGNQVQISGYDVSLNEVDVSMVVYNQIAI